MRGTIQKATVPLPDSILYTFLCSDHLLHTRRPPHTCILRHQPRTLQGVLINASFTVMSLEDNGEYHGSSVGN